MPIQEITQLRGMFDRILCAKVLEATKQVAATIEKHSKRTVRGQYDAQKASMNTIRPHGFFLTIN